MVTRYHLSVPYLEFYMDNMAAVRDCKDYSLSVAFVQECHPTSGT